MSRNDGVLCHITDAVGVVHVGLVYRQLKNQRVRSFTVTTGCAPQPRSWEWTRAGDQGGEFALPQGFDLPKLHTEAGLLVRYLPRENLAAPALTCFECVAMFELIDSWAQE